MAGKDTETLARLTGILDARGVAWHSRPQGDGGCIRVWFRHPSLVAFLDRWYLGGRSQKRPPREVERLPFDWQAELARGYIAADGHINSTRVAVTSVSLSGLLAFRRILARLGIAASIADTGRPAGPMRIMGRDCTIQDSYLLHFTAGADRLALPVQKRDPRRLERSVIEAGHRWTRVRSVCPTDDVRTFIAVTTSTEDYVTHFGRSHNCAYVVGSISAEAEIAAEAVQAMPKHERDETIGRLYAWERAWRLFGGDEVGANLPLTTAWQARNVACPMLDLATNRCRIYPVRPIGCRVHHALELPPEMPAPPCRNRCAARPAPQGCRTTEADVACGHPPTTWQLRNDLIPHWQFILARRLGTIDIGILPLQVLRIGRRRWDWQHPRKLLPLPLVQL